MCPVRLNNDVSVMKLHEKCPTSALNEAIVAALGPGTILLRTA